MQKGYKELSKIPDRRDAHNTGLIIDPSWVAPSKKDVREVAIIHSR